ncbi:MAG: hypothetical protein BVN35_08985 [Proteobacteria bacterium ST_bin11]|nr:MAG: hypothetical protein BVN35_08985 [Proteobacteria bacterium ST_bin11]
MKTVKILMCALLAGAAFTSVNAQAAVVTSNAGFTVLEDFEGFDGLVEKGPIGIAGGVVFQSSVYSTLGAYAVDLVDNGTWGAGNKFAGIGDLSFVPSTFEGFDGSMTFTLGSAPAFGIGAKFSIYNDGAPTNITIEALGLGNSVLESHEFTVDLDNVDAINEGVFAGFNRATADVIGLRISGDGFVVDDLSVRPVPVPPAFALMLSGVLGLFGFAKRRNA